MHVNLLISYKLIIITLQGKPWKQWKFNWKANIMCLVVADIVGKTWEIIENAVERKIQSV